VAKDDLLAQIDDEVPRMQHEIAEFKLAVAKKQAEDDVDIRYAIKAADHAKAQYDGDVLSNEAYNKSVPRIQVDEHKLEWEKMLLATEKARKDQAVNKLQMGVSQAELNATAENVKRRKVTAPLEGVVSELTRHIGEWVQQGEPLMKLVRIDLLRVEGRVGARDYRPSELYGKQVDIVVEFAHGKTETFHGKIVFVSPVLESSGDFVVRAEVQNRRDENGFWVLTAGLPATMTIKLK
jgi:multidrug resistance efflux pump